MKRGYYFLFIAYFLLSLISLFVFRLILSGGEGLEQYDERYDVGEEFLSLDLESGKQVPFLRLHRYNLQDEESRGDEIIISDDIKETGDINTQEIIDNEVNTKFGVYVFPEDFYEDISQGYFLESMKAFLKLPFIDTHIDTLDILLFSQENLTRGQMFRKRIYLYSLERIPYSEALSVFIHEFGHYYDIYGLSPTRFGDISEKFYELSWQDIDILRAGQSVNDFVSGYAMTNMYEDFAESYTYYVLHNSSFREKSLQSTVLARKYAFFEQHAFPKKEFYMRNFSSDNNILPYYWDITKIEIDVEKFLQYIKIYL
ncbi:putative zinc-binding metallopeptidase [Candidatus Gracilibacteria bacterium]|nr:putative zinc-binding metallopeptidase [Candidatus Gracilibacteria bacterium]